MDSGAGSKIIPTLRGTEMGFKRLEKRFPKKGTVKKATAERK